MTSSPPQGGDARVSACSPPPLENHNCLFFDIGGVGGGGWVGVGLYCFFFFLMGSIFLYVGGFLANLQKLVRAPIAQRCNLTTFLLNFRPSSVTQIIHTLCRTIYLNLSTPQRFDLFQR